MAFKTASSPRTPAARGKGRKVLLLGHPSTLADELRLEQAAVEEIAAELVLDDASWAPVLARIKAGEFQAVCLQLDDGT